MSVMPNKRCDICEGKKSSPNDTRYCREHSLANILTKKWEPGTYDPKNFTIACVCLNCKNNWIEEVHPSTPVKNSLYERDYCEKCYE